MRLRGPDPRRRRRCRVGGNRPRGLGEPGVRRVVSESRLLTGIGVSPGVAVGPALVLNWTLPEVPQRVVAEDEVETEVTRLHEALAAVRGHLEMLRRRTEQRVGPEEAKIFDAQTLMLEDREFLGAVERLIRDNQLSAERAFEFK